MECWKSSSIGFYRFAAKKGIQTLLIYYLWDIKNCAKNLLQDLIQVFRGRQILLYGFMVLSCRLMHRNCNTLRLELYKSVWCSLFVGEKDYILVFMQFRKQTIKLTKPTFHCVAVLKIGDLVPCKRWICKIFITGVIFEFTTQHLNPFKCSNQGRLLCSILFKTIT